MKNIIVRKQLKDEEFCLLFKGFLKDHIQELMRVSQNKDKKKKKTQMKNFGTVTTT